MARGFESKMVEFNQEEAARKPTGAAKLTPQEQAQLAQRRSLELARAKAVGDLGRATAPAHRQMLEQTIAAIDEQLRSS